MLDSRGFDPDQLAWLQSELAKSETAWKICYFHHPIYTSAATAPPPASLRLALEPILIKGDVDVVLSGHEHFYERIKPQHGISYFISGGAGSLRKGDITPSPRTARGFDTDYHFMMMEVSGDTLYFQAISRTGETVDAGAISRGGQDGQSTVTDPELELENRERTDPAVPTTGQGPALLICPDLVLERLRPRRRAARLGQDLIVLDDAGCGEQIVQLHGRELIEQPEQQQASCFRDRRSRNVAPSYGSVFMLTVHVAAVRPHGQRCAS